MSYNHGIECFNYIINFWEHACLEKTRSYIKSSTTLAQILNVFNVNDYFFQDILSSSLCFVISLSIRSLQARPVKSIFFSSVLNAWLRIPAIDSQATGLFGFLAVTSVANIMSLFIEGHAYKRCHFVL